MLRELRFEPEYYQDASKMTQLDEKIDDVHNEINALMQLWEEYSELMNSLQSFHRNKYLLILSHLNEEYILFFNLP